MGVGWSALWLSETQYQPKGDGVLHVCWGGRPSSKTSLSGKLKIGPLDTNILIGNHSRVNPTQWPMHKINSSNTIWCVSGCCVKSHVQWWGKIELVSLHPHIPADHWVPYPYSIQSNKLTLLLWLSSTIQGMWQFKSVSYFHPRNNCDLWRWGSTTWRAWTAWESRWGRGLATLVRDSVHG